MSQSTISVGIDRSDTAQDALRWAAGFASAIEARVRAVSTWRLPIVAFLPPPIDGLPTAGFMAAQSAAILDDVINRTNLDIAVEQVVLEGVAGPTLVADAATADLLVVGRSGHGKRHGIARLAEIVLGSTAHHCVHRAPVPVAAIPKGSAWVDAPTAVVGLDGSAPSFAALEWALTSLPSTADLHVVRAFAPWVGDGLMPMDLVNNAAVHNSLLRETESWVDAIVARVNPTVAASPIVEVGIGSARNVLVDRDHRTDILVLGERGRSAMAARALGSVSDHLVRFANCPVVIVPDHRTEAGAP